jgi:hypothetical protein
MSEVKMTTEVNDSGVGQRRGRGGFLGTTRRSDRGELVWGPGISKRVHCVFRSIPVEIRRGLVTVGSVA